MFVIFLFLYAPIVLLMVFSFNDSKSTSQFTGFSLRWYQELFSDSQIMDALGNTLLVAVLSSLAAAAIGTLAAIGIHRYRGWKRSAMTNVSNLPMLNPDILTGISLMLLFIMLKFPLGLMTMLIAHITFNIPYVILSVLPHLRQMNPNTYEAALDLGASPAQAFFRVMIPELLPGIVSGTLLAFTMSIDDFIISFFVTGATTTTLPLKVYSSVKTGVSPQVNALCTLTLFVVAVLVALSKSITRRNHT